MRNTFLLFLVLFQVTNSYARELCENGRNFIFLIHGINGSERTFGSMEKYLNQNDACNKAQGFIYDTGNSKLSTYHFSDDLSNFIQKSMDENNFAGKDKISLIMHSQGGIVGTLWLNKIRTGNPELFKKVDSFITLSTPYWGSSMATIGDNFFFTLPEKADNPISPIGRTELEEMSHGSATIKAMQSVYHDVFSSHIRALAIGGLKRNFNPYFGEDDTTVSVYSSRPDHFSLTTKVFSGNKAKVKKEAFNKTELIQFVPVQATHFKFDLPGVASLPSDCLIEDSCDHPSIDYINKHLAGEPVQPEEGYEFKKYRVNVYVQNWRGLINNSDDIEIELIKPHGEDEKIDFKFRPGNELSSSFTGILKHVKIQTLVMKLKINGKVVKTVEAPVQGGFSTFVNFDLSAQ